MPNRTSQDEDSAENSIPEVKPSIKSDQASEEEETEDEEDVDTAPLSRPHQLVRSWGSPFILLPTTIADFILYTPSFTYLNLRI